MRQVLEKLKDSISEIEIAHAEKRKADQVISIAKDVLNLEMMIGFGQQQEQAPSTREAMQILEAELQLKRAAFNKTSCVMAA